MIPLLLLLAAIAFAVGDLLWGSGFDGRGLAAVILALVAAALWARAEIRRHS